MSSETSTEAPAFQPKHFFAITTMLAATAAVLVAPKTSLANLILVSLAVMATGLVAAAAYHTIYPLTRTDDPVRLTRVGGRAMAALEREKALVLRSIKELEFDRAMGKVADADFEDMATRLRARAIGLMKQLDREQPDWDAVIAAELAKRRGASVAHDHRPTPSDTPQAVAPVFCTACGVHNESDARFCKACGHKMSSVSEDPTPS